MNYFVSKDDVLESVDYFKKLDTNDLFYHFLILKRVGITIQNDIQLSGRKANNYIEEEIMDAFEVVAGLRNTDEDFTKYSIAFPSNFDQPETRKFYQPRSDFKLLRSRFNDTLKNQRNRRFYNYNENTNSVTLVNDYLEIIKEHYLFDTKVSLKQFASWIFRFTEFPFTNETNSIEFSRVIKEALLKYFKFNKKEIETLFIDDLKTNLIKPSQEKVNAHELREYLDVTEIIKQNNENLKNTELAKKSIFTEKDIHEYSEIKGDNPSFEIIKNLLLQKKQIILTGVPGIGKSFYSKKLSQEIDDNNNKIFDKTWFIQFHQNYSYEEFIGGETITIDSQTGNSKITTFQGKLLEAIEKAKINKELDYLFIIDEINRGNISSIFGETILLLDREYEVILSKPLMGVEKMSLPENLYLVGTMNTTDRNIAFLDLAIRRRFGFVELQPNSDYLSEMISLPVIIDGNVQGYYNLGAILDYINNRIVELLSDINLRLGQSYFIPSEGNEWTWDEFLLQFNYVILPTLKEYSFISNGIAEKIVGDYLVDGIQNIDLFKESFQNEFSEMIIWK